jgi:plastocyanin
VLTPTTHGNGYLNSGIIFDRGFTKPPGASSFTVTFPTAGIYSYLCLVHPEMKGRIVVS